MSSKKSKLDLLVRVRYSNPLPPPPFPPKLLNIPTHPSRYARFDFTSQLADETPFPMVVDAELGMPIDLSKWDGLWDYDQGDDLELNPDDKNPPELDPKDAFLVSDLPSAYFNGGAPSSSSATTPSAANVSWLRKTEYISSSVSSRNPTQEIKPAEEPVPDVSHEAQIADIEASFPDPLQPIDLATLRHPSKPHLRAVDYYDILPDVGIWPNAYDLVKFSERPGERSLDQSDPRLDSAVIRPIIGEDGESFLSYYLTKEDVDAASYSTRRLAAHERTRKRSENPLPDNIDEDEDIPTDNTAFYFLRDYETVKIDTDVPNEFLLTLSHGDQSPSLSTSSGTAKGAYYKNIERKYVLKKKRQNKHEDYSNRWDVIRLSHEAFSEDQLAERAEALAEVNDPSYLFNAAQMEIDHEVDADGEGEGEVDVTATEPERDMRESSVASVDVKEERVVATDNDPDLDVRVNGSIEQIVVNVPNPS